MIEVQSISRGVLEVAWSPSRAYALVADVPLSASHYPGLTRLDDLGDATYRWHLSRYEVAGHSLDVGYTARYICDPGARHVTWRSELSDRDNVAASGFWRVAPLADGARLDFETALHARVPVPRLVGRLARRTVDAVFQRQIETYLDAIAQRMGGRRTVTR